MSGYLALFTLNIKIFKRNELFQLCLDSLDKTSLKDKNLYKILSFKNLLFKKKYNSLDDNS